MRWVEDTGGTEGAEISGVYIKSQNILLEEGKNSKAMSATDGKFKATMSRDLQNIVHTCDILYLTS